MKKTKYQSPVIKVKQLHMSGILASSTEVTNKMDVLTPTAEEENQIEVRSKSNQNYSAWEE
jgi:hypothetical protein